MKALPKEFFQKTRKKSTKKADNITPFKWSKEVLNGTKKVTMIKAN